VDRHASRVLPWSERFFQRHGGKTIFLARFVAVLRVTAAWIAGLSKMHWWQFFLWNAAGGIVWAVAVGLVAYYVGEAAAAAIGRWGLIAGAAIFVLLVAGALVFRFIRRRMLGAESEA
jgi:membrane protein DedA with SNARE-associated domain